MPGKENSFSDATSRNPVGPDDEAGITNAEVLAGIMVKEVLDAPPVDISATLSTTNNEFRAITWDLVKQETKSDQSLQILNTLVSSSFPDDKTELPKELLPYFNVRNNL